MAYTFVVVVVCLFVSGYLQLEHFKFSMNSNHCSEYKTEKHMHVCKSIYLPEVHKSVSFLFVFVFVLITAQQTAGFGYLATMTF